MRERLWYILCSGIYTDDCVMLLGVCYSAYEPRWSRHWRSARLCTHQVASWRRSAQGTRLRSGTVLPWPGLMSAQETLSRQELLQSSKVGLPFHLALVTVTVSSMESARGESQGLSTRGIDCPAGSQPKSANLT